MNHNSSRRKILCDRIKKLELFQIQLELATMNLVSFDATTLGLNDDEMKSIMRLMAVRTACRSIIKICEIESTKIKYIQELRMIETESRNK